MIESFKVNSEPMKYMPYTSENIRKICCAWADQDVELIELVLCRNCKYFHTFKANGMSVCQRNGLETSRNDYCSKGVLK